MATVIRPLGITTFYTLILNLLYTNQIILHVPTYYHHNSNHVSEIPRRPLILFIGVCHKLYFCGIELSSINLLKFLCWKFWVGGGVLPIRHFPWSLATCHVEVKNGGLRKKPCHFLQKPRPAVYVQNYVAPMPRGQEPIKTSERETEQKSDFGQC